jgi:LysR family positive regulator for ilvC
MTDQDSLRLFITLAEQLHFRKTSAKHHMTTSALTRAIQRLEETLKVTLFERNNRSVKLTDSGTRFYTFARQSVAEYEQLQIDLHTKNPTQLKGAINIYSTVTAAYSILPDLIKRFRKKYPLVMTYLETGVAKGGYSRLSRGETDFSIGIITPEHHPDVLFQKILETPLVFILPKNSPKKGLKDFPLIFPEQGELATIITRYLHEQKLAINVHSYVEGHEAILAMVAAGLGAAILPKIVIDTSHLNHDVICIPLKAKLPSMEIGLFVKKSSLDSPVKRAFWESCR